MSSVLTRAFPATKSRELLGNAVLLTCGRPRVPCCRESQSRRSRPYDSGGNYNPTTSASGRRLLRQAPTSPVRAPLQLSGEAVQWCPPLWGVPRGPLQQRSCSTYRGIRPRGTEDNHDIRGNLRRLQPLAALCARLGAWGRGSASNPRCGRNPPRRRLWSLPTLFGGCSCPHFLRPLRGFLRWLGFWSVPLLITCFISGREALGL